MAQPRFIEHKGKKIYHIDLTNADLGQIQQIIKEAKPIISQQAPGSLLTLTDVTNIVMGGENSKAIKEFAAHNKPYVKAGAVLGISGLRQVTFNAVLVFTGRSNLHLFDDAQKAKDWLVAKG